MLADEVVPISTTYARHMVAEYGNLQGSVLRARTGDFILRYAGVLNACLPLYCAWVVEQVQDFFLQGFCVVFRVSEVVRQLHSKVVRELFELCLFVGKG